MATPLNQLNIPQEQQGGGNGPELIDQVMDEVENGAPPMQNMGGMPDDIESFSDVSATSDNEQFIQSAIHSKGYSSGASNLFDTTSEMKQAALVILLYVFFQSGVVNSLILSTPKLTALFGVDVGKLNSKGLLLKAVLFGVAYFVLRMIMGAIGV